jgi:hypothetical protein
MAGPFVPPRMGGGGRILKLLFTWQEGAIATMELVERVRGAVLDPLPEQQDG